MEVIGDKILGSWRLEKWIYENEAGDEIKYFSESPSGILIYEPSGYMSVQIQQSGRANFESQTLDVGTIKEKSGAFGSYLAYYGQFVEHNPGEFTHTVEGSLFPNWVGFQKEEDIYEAGEEVLKMFKKMDCKKILNDNRGVRGPWNKASDWTQNVWSPNMIEAGMQKFAWVFPDNVFAELSAS
jgi:hypothetical protein